MQREYKVASATLYETKFSEIIILIKIHFVVMSNILLCLCTALSCLVFFMNVTLKDGKMRTTDLISLKLPK